MRLNTHVRFVVFVVLISCFLPSCGGDPQSTSTGEQLVTGGQAVTAEQLIEGEQLARTHCGSCHLYPEPSLLDSERWKQVLPNMGHRLGIYRDADRDSLISRIDLRGVDTTRIFPEQPLLSSSEWDKIEAFYRSASPDEMEPVRRPQAMHSGLEPFEVRMPRRRFETPLTLLTKMQPEDQLFFLGNVGYGSPSTLSMISSAGQVLFERRLRGAPIDVHWEEGRLYVLLVGSGPQPTEASAGSLLRIDSPEAAPRPVLTGLKRPVDLEVADLNGDGMDDFVICEYGREAGFLSLYVSDADGRHRRRVLSEESGAVEAVIHDFDDNGTPDIGVLMAEGDEGFDVYANDGDGRFTRHRKLRFPPVFGSTDIQIVDFNADGHMDLLYVNGDNLDYTRVVKPYHGVRLYLADGNGEYREAMFFPLPGAYSARAGDFDGDGDLDIAAISYFPDYRKAPEEGFVYLENKGDLQFEGHTAAGDLPGRWITMDAGDLDGDGDLDILLGSNIGFSPEHDTTGLFQRWTEEGLSFVWMENTRR